MNGSGDYGAWTSDDFDEYEAYEYEKSLAEEAWQDSMGEADNNYWADYFGAIKPKQEKHTELFTRWEHELSLPDHYGNRAYTHWFVEVAL